MTTDKQRFTVERAYLLPVYQHVTVEAATADEAARLALLASDWTGAKEDYDNSRNAYIDGIWLGDVDYSGPSLDIPADLQNPERAIPEALEAIVREMLYGDGTDASLQRVIDLCNKARDRFDIKRQPVDPLTPEERALHVCEVAGCDRIPEAGTVCNACLPGLVADADALTQEGDHAQAAEIRAAIADAISDGEIKSPGICTACTTPQECREKGWCAARDDEDEPDHFAIALHRARRDAEQIVKGADNLLESSQSGRAGDLQAIEQRVDELLRMVSFLGTCVGHLADAIEKGKN